MTTITLEPLIDQLPVLLVSGDGTVLDGNLAWTRLVASRHGAGARPGLYDLIAFEGAPVSPTAGPREMRVHHIAPPDVGGDGRAVGEYSAALFVPVVHRRRDTYVVFLLPPRTFRPDAARFAGLLAADVGGRGSEVGSREPEPDLILPIDVEGLVRNAADLVAATAAPDAGTSEDLPTTILSRLRCGIPSRRLVLSVSAGGGAAIPEGVFRLPPDGATPQDVRRGPAPLLRHAPADAGVEGGAAVRECPFEALPAWLQREFVDSPGPGGSRRYLVASVVIPGGAAVLAAGPWGAGESVSPDEPSLVEIAIRLLAARAAVAARERTLEERARRLDAALEAERAASGRSAERAAEAEIGSEPVAPPIDLSVSFTEMKQALVDGFERAYIEAALRRSGGNLSAAARLARMDKKNFHAKASRLGLAGPASEARRSRMQ